MLVGLRELVGGGWHVRPLHDDLNVYAVVSGYHILLLAANAAGTVTQEKPIDSPSAARARMQPVVKPSVVEQVVVP